MSKFKRKGNSGTKAENDSFDYSEDDLRTPNRLRRAKTPIQMEQDMLKAKLDEVLIEVQKMTKSIVSLIKEPTGSNPVVSKLADILFTSKIDIEDFIRTMERSD